MLWQRYVAAGTPPEVPTGIADAHVLLPAGRRKTSRSSTAPLG